MLLCFGVDKNIFTVPCLALIKRSINLSLSSSKVPNVKLFPLDLTAGMTLYSPKCLPQGIEVFLEKKTFEPALLTVSYVVQNYSEFHLYLIEHLTPSTQIHCSEST